MSADLEDLSGNTLKAAECDEPAAPGCSPVHISSKNTLRTSPLSREILLPTEIITQILTYIPRRPASQSTFHALCLVSRAWYTAAIGPLYIRPYITPNNFSQFVSTVCPSKNAHILPSPLSVLVRSLDMGELVHNSSKSLTARLLGRLKGNLEQFVAPQASFAINSFAALSKCTSLTHLDLSLLSASISNKMLFQSLAHLTHLETLLFPRSSALDQNIDTLPYTWPPKLRALHLAGGISDDFLLTHMSTLPLTLQKISIQHCSSVHPHAITHVLETLGPQLTHLTIRHPMRHLFPSSLDTLLTFCPSLLALRISADFISPALFTPAAIPPNHSLRILDLECSTDPTADVDIQADSVYEAAESGLLPDLRRVCVSARLAWGASEKTRRDAADLLEVMEEGESERPLGIAPEVLYWMSDTI
ncbi:F-box domain protein [Drepanopeziza brunnea f. sp. 'multigermtubi' MB_m1]|uniref:F-box domain protein n=1 Tax=Marssonina brunnea f. sp. multigermtubi (strain MB_m1) TaxID=1072389 RepID=K1WIE7_MARBU|nr:F-box domain protein [Drepanopeziza brunnea f. sp. 'multigermtubi' MB_m1]EKD11972.1 F-box domain protein [Drepanopeziza brunnea f. sp. 'multigermtubi' MB_m1]